MSVHLHTCVCTCTHVTVNVKRGHEFEIECKGGICEGWKGGRRKRKYESEYNLKNKRNNNKRPSGDRSSPLIVDLERIVMGTHSGEQQLCFLMLTVSSTVL